MYNFSENIAFLRLAGMANMHLFTVIRACVLRSHVVCSFWTPTTLCNIHCNETYLYSLGKLLVIVTVFFVLFLFGLFLFCFDYFLIFALLFLRVFHFFYIFGLGFCVFLFVFLFILLLFNFLFFLFAAVL